MGTSYTDKENLASVYCFGPYTVVGGTDRNSLGINRRVLFNLTAFNTGTYNIGRGNSNNFSNVDGSGNDFIGKSGVVNITSNSNSLISRNFSCTLAGPSNTTNVISGSFTNVPTKQ
jgi:hypothetical protein